MQCHRSFRSSDRINRIIRILLLVSPLPDEGETTQSDYGGKVCVRLCGSVANL